MVRVKLGSVYHYGIFVSEEEIIAFGLPPLPRFAQQAERFLVCRTDAEVFCCGQILETAILDRTERKRRFPPEETVRRARARLGEDGYHLIRNNCEHFVNECVFGEKKSLQEEAMFRMWNTRPVINVYLAEADRFTFDFPVPAERRSEIDACSDASMKRARIANWALLRLAARHGFSLDPDEVVFSRKKHGGWTADRFFCSFSHADGLCCVAVSNAPIGVDFETVEDFTRRLDAQKLQKLRARCFTKAERNAYPDSIESFLICWTRKEAIFKQTGKRAFSPDAIETRTGAAMTYRLDEPKRAVLSLCGEYAGLARFYRTDGNEITPLGAEGPLDL
jgi:phosphopantetheine--protein transferase-like protein